MIFSVPGRFRQANWGPYSRAYPRKLQNRNSAAVKLNAVPMQLIRTALKVGSAEFAILDTPVASSASVMLLVHHSIGKSEAWLPVFIGLCIVFKLKIRIAVDAV